MAGVPSTTARPATRPASAQEVELKAKLAEGNAEIETLKTQVKSSEETIAQLREQVASGGGAPGDGDGAEGRALKENEEALASLQSEHESAVAGLETRLSEFHDKLQAAEGELDKLRSDLAEAMGSKEATESELEALKQSVEAIKAENDEKLKASETAFQKTQDDHASKMDELKASLADQHKSVLEELETKHKGEIEKGVADALSHEAAINELKSQHESAVAELQKKVDDLTASQTALESANSDKARSEQQAHNTKIAELEGELAKLKARLDVSGKATETAQAEMKSANGQLAQAQGNLAAVKEEAAAALQAKTDEAMKKLEEGEKRMDEFEAQLKVKEAELAEAKAKAAAGKAKGLSSSRFADGQDEAASAGKDEPGAAEGEDDNEDHSSAALASLSKARLTAKQMDALDREMRDRNLQLLNSITNANVGLRG